MRRWLARPAAFLTGAVLLAAAGLGVAVLPGMLAPVAAVPAMFTAPMLMLRAAAAGVVTAVDVGIGQAVDPATPLLTIHVNPVPDGALADLKARLAQARAHQSTLDGTAPAAEQRQAAAEVEQLQKAVASATTAIDQPVLAGVRGVVWSLDAQAGGRLQAGDPLVQLADCGHAFLVLRQGAAGLRSGQTVLIHMPGLRPFHGTVRQSAGVSEPVNTLLVDPTGFAAVAPTSCPVGVTAEIQPERP